ncbi:hypothetical protein G6F35_016400 [Rhizopus arrhizus]|nr:hypothetical protein G6F35_016400 [Rhizopus arrhizus]
MAPGQSKRPWGAPTVGRTLTATMTAPSTPTPPRPERQADAEGGAQQAERTGARHAVEQRGQRRHGGGERGRAAHALHQPHDVDPARGGQIGDGERGGAEPSQAQQPDPAGAVQIGQAARHHDDAAVRKDVAVQDPVQFNRRAAQRLADRRQDHGGAGETQRDEQGCQAGRQQLQPAMAGGWGFGKVHEDERV